MGNQRFANRASSVLADPITNVAGTLNVSAGEGARFPVLTAGQHFRAMLQDGDGDNALREYVKVTARVGDALTLDRGTEGSVARAWVVGTNIVHIVTAASMDDMAGKDDLQAVQAQVNATDATVGGINTRVTAVEGALPGKEPSITAGTIQQYWRGDKTWRDFATDVRSAVLTGLSTATNSAVTATDSVLVGIGKLQAKVNNLANDVRATVLTGIDTATSAAITAADTVLGALGKLQAQVALRAPLASPPLTGTPTAPTPAATDDSTKLATTAWSRLGFAISLGSIGFIKLPTWLGALILQWGTYSGTIGSAGEYAVNLPIVFPNNHFATVTSNGDVNIALDSCGPVVPSANGFVVVFHNGTTRAAAGTTRRVNWWSIGN